MPKGKQRAEGKKTTTPDEGTNWPKATLQPKLWLLNFNAWRALAFEERL
jgi:hypothetical protein